MRNDDAIRGGFHKSVERPAVRYDPMPGTVERIVEETRQWPEDVVTELIDRIVLAKHVGIAPEREVAWTDETARRAAKLDCGQATLVPGDQHQRARPQGGV